MYCLDTFSFLPITIVAHKNDAVNNFYQIIYFLRKAKKVLTNEYTSDKIIIRKRGKNEQKEKRYW